MSRVPCQIYNNILETIGNTPVVRINKLAPKHVNLYVKCEYLNPLSSIKDRLGLAIIEDAERRGVLQPNQTVIEATSGNTGIGLAMVCAQKGYPFVATMCDCYSVERRKIMRALGAKVVLTPAKDGGIGMVKKAEELATTHKWYYARQFENAANAEHHEQTTGPEILSAFKGKKLDYWVTGYGTGGTFTGVGRALKRARPDLKVILSEPKKAPLIASGIPQSRDANGAPKKGHPSFSTHSIQGWTPNFISKVAQDGVDMGIADQIIHVEGDEAMKCAMDLAQREGIFTGTSGGATVATALKLCEDVPEGTSILAMLPDTMERYMTTPLFERVAAEMNEEEVSISKSTPHYQLEDANGGGKDDGVKVQDDEKKEVDQDDEFCFCPITALSDLFSRISSTASM